MSLHNENTDQEHVNISNFGELARSHSSHFTHVSGSSQSSKNNCPLAAAFDKSNALELHLKWTQAFFACEFHLISCVIPFFKML